MKINLRESLNELDMLSDNRYDLYNTYLSKNPSLDTKKKLSEAIYSNKSPKEILMILNEDWDDWDGAKESEWEEMNSKSVRDSDGFLTDYTWYRNNETGQNVFVFGDKDLYGPEDGYFDWECDTDMEGFEWFKNYVGPGDEDDDWMDESLKEDTKERILHISKKEEPELRDRNSVWIQVKDENDIEKYFKTALRMDPDKIIIHDFDIDEIPKKLLTLSKSAEIPVSFDESLDEAMVKVEPSDKELNQVINVLNKYGFKVDDNYKPGRGLFGSYHIQVINPDLDYIDFDQLVKDVEPVGDALDNLSFDINMPITYNFGANDDNVITGGIDIHVGYKDDDIDESLKEDSNLDDFIEPVDQVGKAKIYYDSNKRTYFTPSLDLDFDTLDQAKDFIGAPLYTGESLNETIVYPNGMPASDIDIHDALNFNFGLDRDMNDDNYTNEEKQRSLNYWINKMDEIDESLNEASYGGAYDIEDDMFFTRDDINEFAWEIVDSLLYDFDRTFEIVDVHMETPKRLYLEVTDGDYDYSATVDIDMRKIKAPQDLMKYFESVMDQIKAQIHENESEK